MTDEDVAREAAKEMAKTVSEAVKDPHNWVAATLDDPKELLRYAQLRNDDADGFTSLCIKLYNSGVKHTRDFKSRVLFHAKALTAEANSHQGPVTMEAQLADCRARVNGQAGALDVGRILEEVLELLRLYMWFPLEEQGWACCLWIVHTYCVPATNTSPRLHIKAPDPECGKTRLMELLVELVFNGKLYIKPTSAVVYRLLNKQAYTFLLDEIDGVYGRDARGDEDLRMIIDAGQRRGGTVPRCVGDAANMDVVDFPVFAPMALAGIGRLPRTVESRSIPIALERKTAREKVSSLYLEDIAEECGELRLRLGAWADGHMGELRGKGRRPAPLARLGDRSNEGWFPLRAIAALAGGPWPGRAVQAAELLSKRQPDKHGGINSADLLRDVRDIFDENPPDNGRLMTGFLLEELNRMEEAPWGVLAKGAGLSSHRLAAVLREYGIESHPFKTDRRTRRGYYREQFLAAWDRYLTESAE